MKHKKVIIADDSLMMRETLTKAVRDKGYMPIDAENGADVLVELRNHGQDVVLIALDWNMPVLDGYETLLKIRAKKEYDNIPILMATADGMKEDVLKAIKGGANGYLVKPFKTEDFANQLDKFIT